MATVASDLASGQIAMVDAARFTYEHNSICPMVFNKMTLGPGEKSKYIPKFSSGGSAQDLTDGVDMTNETALQITGTTQTTDEAGCKVIITKKLRTQLKADAFEAAGRVVGNMISRKQDEDGLALFSGLSTSLGAAGTALTLGFLAAALTQLDGQSEPAPWPRVGVFHPHQVNPVLDQLTVPSATLTFPDTLSLPLLQKFWRGTEKLYGIPIFTTGHVSIDASDDAYGAIFAPMCFVYLVGWEPENWIEEDKSLRGWEIGVVADYAMVEEDDGYGRAMLFDAVAPTS